MATVVGNAIIKIVAALGGAPSADGYLAHCPAHEDKKPSLSLKESGGKILFHCHAGCTQDVVLAALKGRGLWSNGDGGRASVPIQKKQKPAPVIPIPETALGKLKAFAASAWAVEHYGKPVARWYYHTADGRVAFAVARYEGDRGKNVVPYYFGGDQAWHSGQIASTGRPLYRLHELLKSDLPVLVVEGEKCAEIPVPGFILTTWSRGATAVAETDWTPLEGRKVFIWPDADPPGQKAAEEVRRRLPGAKVLAIPADRPQHWDIADATAESVDLVAFIGKSSAAQDPAKEERRIQYFSVKDIMEFPPVEYVIGPYLPRGAVVNLSAYTGTGKTVFTSALCLAAMSGAPFLEKFEVKKRGRVMYFDEENPQSYVKDRLGKMGFREEDPFMLAHFSGLKLDNDKDFELICQDVKECAPVLVVFDTLIRFHTSDENDASAMSLVMSRLRQLANLGPTVLTQIHQNKGSGDRRTRSRGSSDIIGGCDLELSIEEQDPKKNPGLLTLQSVKARMAPVAPVTFRIQETNGQLSVVLADESSGEVAAALDEILGEAPEGIPRGGNQQADRLPLP